MGTVGCPVHWLSETDHDKAGSGEPCMEQRCGWWDREARMCSVESGARALRAIAKVVQNNLVCLIDQMLGSSKEKAGEG